MKDKMRFLVMLFTLVIVAGCDLGQFTQSKEFKDYVISVTHDPHPIIINQPVKLYATLRRGQSGVSECRVSLKTAKAHSDQMSESVNMPEGGRSGIYHAKGIVFNETGDWEFIVNVNCAGRERDIHFPVVVSGS